MPDSTDRGSLLNQLLVQSGFLAPDELATQVREWSSDKQRPFESFLVERGVVEAADLDALRPLLDRQVARQGQVVGLDGKSHADSLATRMPGAVEVEVGVGVVEDDPHATRMPVASAGPVGEGSAGRNTIDDDPLATRVPDAQEMAAISASNLSFSNGRYRKIRDHAKGGLGVVFVALDQELNREVALKEIQDRHADDPGSQARFLLEAEITGGLEHPGIIPVYGLGSNIDGRPYYAMRFIRGDSLKDAIVSFHADEALKADPGAYALALQKLLRRFLDVCNAIEYAHSRGVVHRDLKPDNVMVGRYGETLVVDWGLAKAGGRPEAGAGGGVEPDSAAAENYLHPGSSHGSNETMPGSVIGTPAYMSPEQAAGRVDLLGPPSDVYSLGATLYFLLAGVNPVRAPDLMTLLDRVSRGEFPPPRQANSAVPRALEAVCLKAMATRIEDRYPSPRALGDDIEQWMADEPVSAYREPLPARVARWGRRHKTLVASILILLLTGGVALSIGYVLVRKERDEKVRLFARAQQTVRTYLVTITDDPDLQNDALSPLRNRLLGKAGDYYKQFLAENRDNPNLRRESAEAYYNLGTLSYGYNLANGDHPADEAALDYHKTALELRREQARSSPNDPSVLSDVARSEEAIANQERLRSGPGHFERARTAYLESIALLNLAVKAAPRSEASLYNDRLAAGLHQLGNLLMEAGRLDEALEPIREAIRLQRSLEGLPALPDPAGNLALYLADLSEWERKSGHADEAIRLAREAQAERDRAWKATPRDAQARYELGVADFTLATMLLEVRQIAEALGWYGKARELLEPLARDYPLRTDYQSMLARVFNGLGEERLIEVGAALEQGQADLARKLGLEAIADYEEHRKISMALQTQRPGVSQLRSDVARSDRNIGSTWFLLKDFEEALKRTLASRDILAKLAVDVPTSVEFRSDLGAAWSNLGLILGTMGRRQEAVDALREAIGHQAFAARRAPQYRTLLFTIHANLASVERDLGHVDQAVDALVEALKLVEGRPMESVGVAIELANCLPPAPGPEGEPEPEPARERRGRIAGLAMDALRQGVKAGFRDAGLLEAEPSLKPLQGRDDFRRLVDSLKTKPAAEPPRPPSP